MASKINTELGLDVTPFQKGLAQATAKLDAFSKRAQNMGSTLSQNVTLPLVGLGAAAVKSFADFSKLENSLAAVMGSSEGAKQEMIALRKVAENPGLAIPQVVQASARLQSVGINAAEARTVITEFGNAVARAGGNADTLDGVVLALTQISAAGKVTQEDLNQIKERLPEFGRVMKEEFGTTTAEGIRALGVSSEEFIQRATKALGGLERANGGLANSFDNFKDSVQGSLAQLGGVIAEAFDLEGILTKLGVAVQAIADWFSDLNPQVQRGIIYFAAFAAAIGPVFFIIGKLAGAIPILSQGFGVLKTSFLGLISPAGLVVAGLAAIAAVAYSVYANYKKLNPEIEDYSNFTSEATKNVIAERAQFNALIDVLKDTNISSSTRKKIIDEINTKYGQYLPNLLSEKESLDNIKAAQDGANKSFADKIKLTALEGIVEKQKARLVELAQDEYEIERKLAEQRKIVASQIPKITGANYVYGQSSAQNSVENLQQAASLRELEQRLTNTRKAQQALTNSFKKSESDLSKLIGDALVVPDKTDTGTGTKTDKGIGATVATNISASATDAEKSIATLSARMFDFAKKAQAPFGFIRTGLQDLGDLTPEVTAQKDALLEYGKSLDSIAQKAALFGENSLAAQIDTTRVALENALVAFGPSSEAVAFLKTEYEGLTNQLAILNEQQATQAKLGETISSIIGNIGQSFTDAISGAISFGEAMRRVITDVISLLIQELVITVVKNTANSPLGKLLGPAIVPVAGAAGVAAGSLAKALLNKVKLANGGLAYGPTLATVGDNPGAISDPEVIAPLSKLKDYLNGGGGYIAETRISGNDLLILVSNAERRNGRIR